MRLNTLSTRSPRTIKNAPFTTQKLTLMFAAFVMLNVLTTSATAQERKSPDPSVVWEDGQWVKKTPWETKPTAIDLHFGLGTPQGLMGVTLTQAFTNNFTLSLGAGTGVTGYQLSLMPRLQFANEVIAFGVGLGPSFAAYTWTPFNPFSSSPTYEADLAVWANGEVFFQIQPTDGFRFGMYGGATTIAYALNPTSSYDGDENADPATLPHQSKTVPYLGLQFGYAF